MSPGLYQDFMNEYIKFFKTPLINDWTVGSKPVVITVGFQLEDPKLNPKGR